MPCLETQYTTLPEVHFCRLLLLQDMANTGVDKQQIASVSACVARVFAFLVNNVSVLVSVDIRSH